MIDESMPLIVEGFKCYSSPCIVALLTCSSPVKKIPDLDVFSLDN